MTNFTLTVDGVSVSGTFGELSPTVALAKALKDIKVQATAKTVDPARARVEALELDWREKQQALLRANDTRDTLRARLFKAVENDEGDEVANAISMALHDAARARNAALKAHDEARILVVMSR